MIKIWLDDIRPLPWKDDPDNFKFSYPFDRWAPYDAHCKTAEHALDFIEKGLVSHISFDHDLGEGLTGYDVAKKIEEWAHQGWLLPIKWKVHSANPVGAANIRAAMESADRAWGISISYPYL